MTVHNPNIYCMFQKSALRCKYAPVLIDIEDILPHPPPPAPI